MITRKALTTLILAIAGGLFLTACEDETAKADEEMSQAIATARHDYAKAAISENPAGDLEKVAGTLAATGSSSAAALLEASARLDAATLHLAEASQIEEDSRALRGVVRARAVAAATLNGIAEANAQFDPSESANVLATARTAMQAKLQIANQAISNLEEPVNKLNIQNTADSEEATRLQAEARELRDQAFEAGDLAGHPLVTQAVERDRQADTLEAAIMKREIELIELDSQLNWARLQKDQLESQLGKTAQAKTDLDEAGQGFAANASTIRATLSEIQKELATTLSTIASNQNRLDTLYGDCSGGLEMAASKADRGSSGQTLKARILQTIGQMHRMNSIGLTNQAALMNHLGGIIDAVGGSGYASQATAASSAADQASQSAQAAFRMAMESLPTSGDAAKLRAHLSAASGG